MIDDRDDHLTPSDLLHMLWLAGRIPGASETILHLVLGCSGCCEPAPVPEEDRRRLAKAHFTEESLGAVAWAMLFYGHPKLALGLRHLTGSCPQCWAQAEPLFRESGEPLTPERAEQLVQGLDEYMGLEHAELERERSQAPSRLEELLVQPQGRRLLLVRNSARYRSPALADLVCQESRRAAPRDAEESLALGELGLEVVAHLSAVAYGPRVLEDLRAFAHAVIGNALRVANRMAEAESSFRRAREHQGVGTGLLPVRAEVDSLEASFFLTRRDFLLARRLLSRARRALEKLEEPTGLARILLQEAHACREMGSSEEASVLFAQAQERLGEAANPRLMLCALHGRLAAAVDLQRFAEADSLLPQVRQLSEALGSSTDLVRLRWVEGEIAAGLGQLADAESIFETVRGELLARGLVIDAALVSLHLCRVYLRQARASQLRQLAQEVAEVLREQRVEKEVEVAWGLVVQATLAERVTEALLTASLQTLTSLHPSHVARGG